LTRAPDPIMPVIRWVTRRDRAASGKIMKMRKSAFGDWFNA